MNFWKKATALIMALGMTFAFAACDNGNTDSSPAESAGESSSTQATPEELSQANLIALVQSLYSESNLKISIKGSYADEDGNVYSGVGSISYADGKCYKTMKKTYESGASVTEENYESKDNGVYYHYLKVDGVWEAQPYEDLAAGEDPTSCKYYLEEIMQWCEDPYFRYDDKLGMHVFTPWEKPELQVMVVGGKIVKYRIEASPEEWEEGELSYGNASVGALPAVNG